MKNTENIVLIKGEFTPAEAKEVLFAILNNKINFHRMKNFSAEERFGKADPSSSKRLLELEQSREMIKDYLSAMEAGGNMVVMESMVQLSAGDKMKSPEPAEEVPTTSVNTEADLIQLW
ncbi:MAG: hypothetical protein ACK4S0_10370 [Sediminibacterium sp.]